MVDFPASYVSLQECTLQETNISPQKWDFEDDFPFPKMGYVSSLEGTPFFSAKINYPTAPKQLWNLWQLLLLHAICLDSQDGGSTAEVVKQHPDLRLEYLRRFLTLKVKVQKRLDRRERF